MSLHHTSPLKIKSPHNVRSLRSSYRSGQQSPGSHMQSSGRKPIARPVQYSQALAPPFFGEISDWRENPFFKQIQKDRDEQNIVMGRKFNLNLDEDGQNLFEETEQHKKEIQEGMRRHIKWEPIIPLKIAKCNSDEGIQKQKQGDQLQSSNQILIPSTGYRLVSSTVQILENSPDSIEQSHEAILISQRPQRERTESQHSNIFGAKKSMTNNVPRFTNITGETRLTTGGEISEGNQNTDRFSKEDTQPFQHFTHSILSDSVINATTEADTTNAQEINLTERSQAGQNSALATLPSLSGLQDPPKLKKVQKKLVKAQPQQRSGEKYLQQFLRPAQPTWQAAPDRVKEAFKQNELARKGPNQFISLLQKEQSRQQHTTSSFNDQFPRPPTQKQSARTSAQGSLLTTMSAVVKGKSHVMSANASAGNSTNILHCIVTQDPSLSELKTPLPVKQEAESMKTLQSHMVKPEYKKSQVNLEVSSDGSDLSDHHLSTIDEKVSFLEIGTQSRVHEDSLPQAYPLKHQNVRGGSRQLPDTDKLDVPHGDSGKQQQVKKKLAYTNSKQQQFKGYQSPKSPEARQKSNTQSGKTAQQAPLTASYNYNAQFSKSHGHQQTSFLSSFKNFNQQQMAKEKNPQPAFTGGQSQQQIQSTNPEFFKTHQVRRSMEKLSLTVEETEDIERKPYIPPNFKKQQPSHDKSDIQQAVNKQLGSNRKPPRTGGAKTRENSGNETKKQNAIIQNETGAFEKVNLSFSGKSPKYRKVEEPKILTGTKSPQIRSSDLQIQNNSKQYVTAGNSRNKMYSTSNSQSRAVPDVQNFQARIGMDKYSTPRSGDNKQFTMKSFSTKQVSKIANSQNAASNKKNN